MIEKFRITQSADNRWHLFDPVQRSFATREELHEFTVWLDKVCSQAAGRQLTPGDFSNCGVGHTDDRSDTERQRAYLRRKHELAALQPSAPTDERSMDERRAAWADEAVERERVSTMTPAERYQHEMRKRLAVSQQAEAAAKADAELRADPRFVKALAEAERVMIAARFNPLLTQADVEELQHQYDVLTLSLDVDRYKEAKKLYDLKIADRFSESRQRAFSALNVVNEQERSVMTAPDAEPEAEQEKPAPLFDREPEPAGHDAAGRELVKVYFDGEFAVISKYLHDSAGTESCLLALARDPECHAEPV